MQKPFVLIAGAGPTGLALALWLTRLGARVRIVDKTAEPGTTSRALAVQARTLELYRQLGIAGGLVGGGIRIAGVNLWVKGKQAARLPLGRIGEGMSPYPFALVFPQDAHERLLVECLEAAGLAVERRTELVRVERSGHEVSATLRRPDGSEETCEPAYLAGCDGAASFVREALGIGFPGGTYEGLFYVADVEASGPVADDELHVDFDDADFLLVFPLRGQRRLRLVGFVRAAPGRNVLDKAGREPDELTFADVSDRAIRHLQLEDIEVHWFSTYHVHHRVAHRFRDGRVFLLGDAAHIHSPVGGQGMNTGIGDAVNLAWKLAAALQDRAAERLLDSYEPERIAFAERLVATTDRAFTVVTRQGWLARLVRTRVVPAVLPVLFRLPAARKFIFRTVSQLGVNYRDSMLSVGAAGRVRGGDRLPWVRIDPATDNFAPLAAIAWQVHVYGEAQGRVADACRALGLPLRQFSWGTEMQRAGLRRGALYLVRPDGYVALADPEADPLRLRRYVEERGGAAVLRGARRRPEPAGQLE
ncbi:MAG TPA: FAD-dependent monooxygenase [Woeseiaceae bacterium]|nr:FAD-dependent monooxygenase [Woeseiaceae bacterium]